MLLLVAPALFGLAATDARAGTRAWDMLEADPAEAGTAPAPAVPESGAEQAGTEQAAGAAASATQQQPTNVVITVRINSPGDDGPISQTNVVVAGANGSNTATTNQGGAPGAATPGQSAETGQQAGATATASQDAAGNLVVVVRINSPGNNGPISQTNASGADANAANTSATNQGQPTAATEPVAPASGGAPASRRPARRPAPDPPRKQPAAVRPATQPAAPAAAPVVRHEAPTAAPAVDRSRASHPAAVGAQQHAKRAPGASSFHHGIVTAPFHRVAAGAADVLDAVTPRTPVAAPDGTDASRSLAYSLLVALAALAAFVVWPQRPNWLRRAQPRFRLRG